MAQQSQVVVIGDIMVDIGLSLNPANSDHKMRLGGIVHACRALWAMNIPYSVAYLAPSYLTSLAEKYLYAHGASDVQHLGTVDGCPNVMIVQNLEETMQQGYEHPLRDEISYHLDAGGLAWLGATAARHVLLFPSKFDMGPVLGALSSSGAEVHVDWANTESDLACLASLGRPLATLITSTSSPYFLTRCGSDPARLIDEALLGPALAVILKENRGGARYASRDGAAIEVGSQLRPIIHSVGVGDAFDAAFVSLLTKHGPGASLTYASWIAAEYASTTYVDDFRRDVQRCLSIPPEEIVEIPGVRLPWEKRKQCHIYLAGPDFDYMDTRLIDSIHQSLLYHNFSPRRPVKENGQARSDSSDIERLSLFEADMQTLESCQMVIAVYEHDDPGTLIEVGIASGMPKPVVVVDPNHRARNPMLLGVAHSIVYSLDQMLVEVFKIFAREVHA